MPTFGFADTGALAPACPRESGGGGGVRSECVGLYPFGPGGRGRQDSQEVHIKWVREGAYA